MQFAHTVPTTNSHFSPLRFFTSETVFTERYELHLQINFVVYGHAKLVAGLSLHKPGFNPGSGHVGFVAEEVEVEQNFRPVLRFSPGSTTPSTLHTRFHLNTARTRRASEQSLGTLKQRCDLSEIGNVGHKSVVTPFHAPAHSTSYNADIIIFPYPQADL
jgi:hypothetical protein